MSATNDGTINRYALPGVPDPVLPADVVNKNYVDTQFVEKKFRSSVGIIQSQIVNNNTTLQNTDLVLPVEKNTQYVFRIFAILSGTTAAGSKIEINVPSGGLFWQFTNRNSQPNCITASGTSAEAVLQTGNTGRVEITGSFTCFNGSGHLLMRFAQKTAEVSNLMLHGGSLMILDKIDPVP